MTKRKKKQAELSAANLKQVLWETMLAVRDGKMKTQEANAIAKQGREIANITKIQLEAAKFVGKASKKDLKKLMV